MEIWYVCVKIELPTLKEEAFFLCDILRITLFTAYCDKYDLCDISQQKHKHTQANNENSNKDQAKATLKAAECSKLVPFS